MRKGDVPGISLTRRDLVSSRRTSVRLPAHLPPRAPSRSHPGTFPCVPRRTSVPLPPPAPPAVSGTATACQGRGRDGRVPYLGRQLQRAASLSPGASFRRPRPLPRAPAPDGPVPSPGAGHTPHPLPPGASYQTPASPWPTGGPPGSWNQPSSFEGSQVLRPEPHVSPSTSHLPVLPRFRNKTF